MICSGTVTAATNVAANRVHKGRTLAQESWHRKPESWSELRNGGSSGPNGPSWVDEPVHSYPKRPVPREEADVNEDASASCWRSAPTPASDSRGLLVWIARTMSTV